MTITIEEIPATFIRKRGAKPECASAYICIGDNGETRDEIYDELILVVPFIRDALYLSAIDFDELKDARLERIYRADVRWTVNPLPSENAPVRFRGSTRGGRAKIMRSFETTGAFVASGQTVKDHGGLIEVQNGKPQGCEVYAPHLECSVEVYLPKPLFTRTYKRRLYQNSPSVNSTAFDMFDPGELLFLGSDWDFTVNPEAESEYVHLSFFFLGSANEEIAIPNIVGTGTNGAVIKKGWEHIWQEYAERRDNATGTTNFSAQVNTERVYPWFDPRRLGITLTT